MGSELHVAHPARCLDGQPRGAGRQEPDALREESREVEGHERRRHLVALAPMVARMTWGKLAVAVLVSLALWGLLIGLIVLIVWLT